MKFTIKNPTAPAEDPIEFSTRIDADGDFMVSANGKDLFFIEAGTGKLHRLYVSQGDFNGLAIEGSKLVIA